MSETPATHPARHPALRSLPALRRLPALALCALLAAALPARAALDLLAPGEDQTINVPTEWWSYSDLTPTELAERVTEHRARIVGLQVAAVDGAGQPRLTARLVRNRGAYAAAGWSWHVDQTAAQLQALVNASQGRLIEAARYDRGGGQIRYAAVIVANQGEAARAWAWRRDLTQPQLHALLAGGQWRPIDLRSHGSGTQRRFDTIVVANTGAARRSFDWALDLDAAAIGTRVAAFGGRIVQLAGAGGGRYHLVQLRNAGSDHSAWWRFHGYDSLLAAEQHARQLGARPLELLRRSTAAGPRYDMVLVDNANEFERGVRTELQPFFDAQQRSLGITSAWLKKADGPVLVDFNGRRPAETASALKVLHLLHALREVQAGHDRLDARFRYYQYDDGSLNDPWDRCPQPHQEAGQTPTWASLEVGLDRMMQWSDNRTTRGVVLRYGRASIEATAAASNLRDTRLRHDIGCAYTDQATGEADPGRLRNDTTAADLAYVYEGVFNRSLLDERHDARREFFESTRVDGLLGADVLRIVRDEARAAGKFDIAMDFYLLMKHWAKGGSYDACLAFQAPGGRCDAPVLVRATAGLVAVPLNGPADLRFGYYTYGALMSDVPQGAQQQAQVQAFWSRAYPELLRAAIREALATW